MVALYNEIDPFAAQWLRQLIIAGHIAPGIVVEDSIEDLHPNDLKPFAQVHLFAGIGVWSYALRRIGVPDSFRVWSCSCPCQPFSAAGKGGGFDDERHLWPHAYHLITQCRPDKIVGEQVASPDGLAWLDLVQTDMETAGYAFGAVDLCAAGVGAPHIRQRTYWVADADPRRERMVGNCGSGLDCGFSRDAWLGPRGGCGFDRLDHHHTGLEGLGGGYRAEAGQREGSVRPVAETGELGGVGHPRGQPGERDTRAIPGSQTSGGGSWRTDGNDDYGHSDAGVSGGMADDPRIVRSVQCAVPLRSGERSETQGMEQRFGGGGVLAPGRPGPTNGHWRDADWLFCRDDKWRPVMSGTFPLAHGAPARVGRLRGYGNAIVAPLAEEFLRAALLDEPVK